MMRYLVFSCMATPEVFAPRFLITCASSSTAVVHCLLVISSFTESRSPYVVMMTSPALASAMQRERFCEKLRISTLSEGANFSNSVFQLGATEAGATTRAGPSFALKSR